jgi:ODAD1 central coiled coil region
MIEKTGMRDSGSNAATNGAPDPRDERFAEMLAENERLRAELAQMRIERDDYLKALYKLAPEYMFTAEEIQEMIANQGSGRAFMDEMIRTLEEAS